MEPQMNTDEHRFVSQRQLKGMPVTKDGWVAKMLEGVSSGAVKFFSLFRTDLMKKGGWFSHLRLSVFIGG